MSSVSFSVDDHDLDDAELWAVIDSAAATHSSSKSRKPVSLRSNNFRTPLAQPSFSPNVHRNPRVLPMVDEKCLACPDGEVLQEAWEHHRPLKQSRACVGDDNDNRIVVIQRSTRPPTPATSSYSSPVRNNYSVQEVSALPLESASVHSLSGRFPSVNLFKQYQNAAMAILEKTDYTMISGNPFIKKSGWRKISFYFNLSFEIKDKSIEFDENRNVQRAEFVVRAYMQGGRFSDGWGSCERREKRFIKPNHDIPSTAETRAKNKACQDLLGIGEYRPGSSNSHR